MVKKIAPVGMAGGASAVQTQRKHTAASAAGAFGAILQRKSGDQKVNGAQQGINFSKHAMTRVEERGIQLTEDLMEKLAGSVEKAQAKGATNILAIDTNQAFIINVPCNRVITTMTQAEMRENFFTNIDGAVLL